MCHLKLNVASISQWYFHTTGQDYLFLSAKWVQEYLFLPTRRDGPGECLQTDARMDRLEDWNSDLAVLIACMVATITTKARLPFNDAGRRRSSLLITSSWSYQGQTIKVKKALAWEKSNKKFKISEKLHYLFSVHILKQDWTSCSVLSCRLRELTRNAK